MSLIQWLKTRLSKGASASASHSDSVDDLDVDPFDPFPEPIEIEITDVIDLHTIPPRQVKSVVVEYLDQAYQAGFRTVRIIHGKGIGVQRELVRSVLAKTPYVQDWTDAPPQAGGLGATIVHLRKE